MSKGKIVIAGGSGLVGKALSRMLQDQGYEIRILTRSPKGKPNHFFWDLNAKEIDPTALLDVQHIINLAGAGIVDKRWTPRRKQVIIDSRTQSNQLLLEEIDRRKLSPKSFITASAIGIYGDRGDEWLTEDKIPNESQDFMVETCKRWEASLMDYHLPNTRKVAIRIGLVLANLGGVLPKLTLGFKFGVAPYFGNGQAFYSWIHITDLCQIFAHAISNDSIEGAYNGVAPEPKRNKSLVSTIKKVKGYGLLLPVPAFLLRLGMGEMAATVLNSNRVSAKKITDSGYQFEYPTAESAIRSLLKT